MKLLAFGLIVALVALAAGALAVGCRQESFWKRDARGVTKGMFLADVINKLGAGEQHKESHFQLGDDDKGVENYYSWSKQGYELQVGLKDGRIICVREWFEGF